MGSYRGPNCLREGGDGRELEVSAVGKHGVLGSSCLRRLGGLECRVTAGSGRKGSVRTEAAATCD